MAGGLVAGCGGGSDPWSIDPEGYDGISEETFGLLANSCTINSTTSTMSLSMRDTETLYLTLRATDNTVIAAAQTAGGAECAVPTSYKIVISEDVAHPGTEKVFLDYINGPFALGTTTAGVATQGITIGVGAGSSLVIRGSSGADKIYLGSTYNNGTLQYSWVNVNGDTSPDVRLVGMTDIKVSTGVGADIISADGGNGTNASPLDLTINFSAYGGPDADTLTGGKGPSLLNGGDGDDKFLQTLTVGADTIVGGKGFDTVDYSVRTTAVNVTVCSASICDVTDVCGCVAADTACRLVATNAKTACDTAANNAKSACDLAANNAKSACDLAANNAKSACDLAANGAKTQCDQDANDAHTTCVGMCQVGDQACIDACDMTLATALGTCSSTLSGALATCSSTLSGALATCTSTQTGALATCTSTQTGALATCTSTQTSANTACDATQSTCQAACTRPLCSVCINDDGAALEGDTVNDDVEIVLGGKLGDTLSAQYGVCSDGATTPTVKCTLKGNEGDDTIIGSAHNDLIDGGAGNDTLQGGLGDDQIIGGAGVDTVSYADRTNAVKVTLDSTRPWVQGQNGETGENDTLAADIENLTGGAGNDFLRGSSGANIIHGGAGADTIEGGAGNDSLYGDAGADLIYGGAGNDILIGGLGADTLVGGDGDDFIDSSDSPAAADTVIDCDGVNDSSGTAGTAPGTADALVKDGSDVGALRCEL